MTKNIEKLIIGSIVAFGLIYMFYTHNINVNEVRENGVYGIGKVIEFGYCSGNSDCGKYEYFYQNKKYVASFLVGRSYFDKVKKTYKHKFYKIKFSKNKPEVSEIFLNAEITNKILIKNAGFDIPHLSRTRNE